MAAELVGDNGRGNMGLVGYLRACAIHEPKAFLAFLGRGMPLQVAGVRNQPLRIITDQMDPQQAADAYAQTVQTITLMIEDRSNRDNGDILGPDDHDGTDSQEGQEED